jgi:hypothetical protein
MVKIKRLLIKASKKLTKSKFLIYYLIPFFLFYIGLNMTFRDVYSTNNGLLILIQRNEKQDIFNYTDKEILAGQKILGHFQASENNLGIVAVRFHTFGRINDDSVFFRIKELNSKDWYYQWTYKTDQFQPDDYFTFGFPIIKDSKDKNYIFELESISGTPGNAVALSQVEPLFIEKYKFDKSELILDKKNFYNFSIQKLTRILEDELVQFVIKKTINIFTDFDFLLKAVFIYFMPLIFYLLWQHVIKKYYAKIYYLAFLSIVGVLGEIYILHISTDMVYLGITLFWLYTIYKYKLAIDVSFCISMFLFILCIICYYLGYTTVSGKYAAWASIFLAVVVVQSLVEILRPPYTMKMSTILRKSVEEIKKGLRLNP